jgi:hypothetical protein
VAGADGNFALDMSQASIAGVAAGHSFPSPRRSIVSRQVCRHSFQATGILAVRIGYGKKTRRETISSFTLPQ